MKNNLRVILAKKKMTIAELSDISNVSKPTLSGLYGERTNNPNAETLLKIAKALNISLDELIPTE